MKRYIMPAPKSSVWARLMVKYGVPEVEHHDGVLCKVTLPAGWIVIKTVSDDPDKKNSVNWDIFDEDGTVMGVIYMTKVLGFTWIYE